MHPRTKRQKEVLDYITRFMERNGYEPSYQQIARQLGVSSRSGIQRHVAALESQGLITRRRDKGSFGIELQLQKIVSDSVCGVELIATADGEGRPEVLSIVTVPRFLIGMAEPADTFAFRVPDDSMIERHICEGDMILLEKRPYARRGEVVVAEVSRGRLTFGLYYQLGPETEIRPANKSFGPTVFPADEIAVQGVMRALMRFDGQ